VEIEPYSFEDQDVHLQFNFLRLNRQPLILVVLYAQLFLSNLSDCELVYQRTKIINKRNILKMFLLLFFIFILLCLVVVVVVVVVTIFYIGKVIIYEEEAEMQLFVYRKAFSFI